MYVSVLLTVALPVALAVSIAGAAEQRVEDVFDAMQWRVVQTTSARFDVDGPPVTVMLLRSRRKTGQMGVGGALRDANVVITGRGGILYRFRSDPPRFSRTTEPRFLLERRLQLRDVTGDAIVEVLFETGFVGGSDEDRVLHVLHWDPRRREFRDIRHPTFGGSVWSETTWLDVEGWPVALRSTPIPSPGSCHSCASHCAYKLYCWNAQSEVFDLIFSGASKDPIDGTPPQSDVDAMLPRLREAVRAKCHRAPAEVDPK